MRGFVVFIVIAAIGGGLLLWQKQTEQRSAATVAPAESPAPSQPGEHDWANRSLDTTHSVIQTIQQQRKDDDLKDAVGRR